MTDARRAFRVYAWLAALGAGLATLALVVASTRVRMTSTAPLEACGNLLSSPDITAAVVLTLLGLGALSLARGAWSVGRVIRDTRRAVAARPVTGRIAGALVVAGDDVSAYCAGLVRPRVYVTEAAVRALGPRELAAVVAHERHHAVCRDPLRLVIVRAVADALFFLPALSRLGDRYRELAEVAADEAALRATGDRAALAAALLAFDAGAGTGGGVASERVDQLCGVRPSWSASHAMLAKAAGTLVAGVAVTALLAVSAAPASVVVANVAFHAAVLSAGAALVALAMTRLARRQRGRRIAA